MASLYPTFPTPPTVTQAQEAVTKYGQAWAFDFGEGDFVLDGGGRVPVLDGHNAWVQWCTKTILTQRFAHIIYGHGYGCEVEQDMSQATSRKAVESNVTRAITEALLADARTRAVRDVTFTWSGADLYVTCTVEPVVGSAAKLEVALNGG